MEGTSSQFLKNHLPTFHSDKLKKELQAPFCRDLLKSLLHMECSFRSNPGSKYCSFLPENSSCCFKSKSVLE